MSGQPFQPKSHWMTTREYTPGPSLEGDVQVDVAIVGGGFTGWKTKPTSAMFFSSIGKPFPGPPTPSEHLEPKLSWDTCIGKIGRMTLNKKRSLELGSQKSEYFEPPRRKAR